MNIINIIIAMTNNPPNTINFFSSDSSYENILYNMRLKRYRGIAIPCRIKIINDNVTEASDSEYWETLSTRGRSPCCDSDDSDSSWETEDDELYEKND